MLKKTSATGVKVFSDDPIIILDGFRLSSRAFPSLRNSGTNNILRLENSFSTS